MPRGKSGREKERDAITKKIGEKTKRPGREGLIVR
jgi:hypothetical protein